MLFMGAVYANKRSPAHLQICLQWSVAGRLIYGDLVKGIKWWELFAAKNFVRKVSLACCYPIIFAHVFLIIDK